MWHLYTNETQTWDNVNLLAGSLESEQDRTEKNAECVMSYTQTRLGLCKPPGKYRVKRASENSALNYRTIKYAFLFDPIQFGTETLSPGFSFNRNQRASPLSQP
ncbi:hypothetical protein J6590_033466 [Homalodisca vitripennis]|nr:hypothetical protein J6590_033466 [Homalodisca vitripennis]